MTIFALFFLPVLLRLGVWQLDRAEEKRALTAQALSQAAALPEPLDPRYVLEAQADAFRPVSTRGCFVSDRFLLLDNQVLDGVVGYWVLQVFEADDGRRWLVNRGFLAGGDDRNQWPAVETPAYGLGLRGLLWPELGLLPLLDRTAAAEEAPMASEGWPKRVQRMDLATFAGWEPKLEPFELRLTGDSAGLVGPAAPAAIPQDADRHQGYAVQWFALAGVLISGWILFGRSRAREQSGEPSLERPKVPERRETP